MKKLFAIIMTILLYTTGPVQAKEIKIDMLNKMGKEKMVYSVDVAKVDVGDTITWLPKDKGHNVEFKKARMVLNYLRKVKLIKNILTHSKNQVCTFIGVHLIKQWA